MQLNTLFPLILYATNQVVISRIIKEVFETMPTGNYIMISDFFSYCNKYVICNYVL